MSCNHAQECYTLPNGRSKCVIDGYKRGEASFGSDSKNGRLTCPAGFLNFGGACLTDAGSPYTFTFEEAKARCSGDTTIYYPTSVQQNIMFRRESVIYK